MNVQATSSGTAAPTELTRRGSSVRWWREWEFWLLAAITTTIYFSRVADLPLRGEEPRRAMVAQEILDRGDWIVPRQQGTLFLSRPPVGSWPIAWLAQATGDLSVWSIRLPTVLATLLTALLVYVYARHSLSRLGALSSGLAYATFAQVLQLGRVAETEATFTLFVSGALLVWHMGYNQGWPALRTWCFAYLLLGIGTLVKSLQAPLYFGATVGLYLLLQRDWRYLISKAHLIGLIVFATLVSAWQWPFYRELGWDAVQKVWASDVGLRFEENSPLTVGGHMATYPLQVLGCLMPWSVLLAAYLRPQFRRTIGSALSMASFLAIAWLVALPTCWFVPNARPRYIMPLYPLAAPLIGLVVQRVFAADAMAWIRRGWAWFIGGSIAAIAGATVAVAAATWSGSLSLPEIAQSPSFATLYVAAAVAAVALLVRQWNCWTSRAATASVVIIASFMGLSVSGMAINSLVALDPGTEKQIAHLKQRLPRDRKLVSFGLVDTLFSYYWREPIKLLSLRRPKTASDLPKDANFDYFCMSCNAANPPRLPFPWRTEAVISCERVANVEPARVVIVGKRLNATSLLPDENHTRR